MALGRRGGVEEGLWVPTTELPRRTSDRDAAHHISSSSRRDSPIRGGRQTGSRGEDVRGTPRATRVCAARVGTRRRTSSPENRGFKMGYGCGAGAGASLTGQPLHSRSFIQDPA
jgi:hypothetical protein